METFHSRRAPTYATHGMVASSQPLATQIGLQTLKVGGNAVDAAMATAASTALPPTLRVCNAVDAAIAMAAMLNITEPMMNGLGGDTFVMVFWQGKLHGLNASGRAGQAMTADALRKGGWKRMPQAGWGSVSVPGAADGYFALHERFGSKRFADGTRGLLRRGGRRCQPEGRSILEMGRIEITTLERVDGTIPRWRAATETR